MEIGAQFACAISAFTDEICTPTIEKWQNVFQFLKTFKQKGAFRQKRYALRDAPFALTFNIQVPEQALHQECIP